MDTAIALFAFNRPIHLQDCLSSLSKNDNFDSIECHIFVDGHKSQADIVAQEQIFRVIMEFQHQFKNISLHKNGRNLGLRESIRKGVSKILKEFESVIVVEDDLVFAPDFIDFMLKQLMEYRDHSEIGSITGYKENRFPLFLKGDTVAALRQSCWGDREIEYGERDVNTLSWNGRMPEVTAAIALEQLRGYPSRLLKIQERVADFRKLISGIADISVVPGANEVELAFTQLSLRINANSRFKKNELMHLLTVQGVQCFHANFEPITELTLFKSGAWLKWVRDGEQRRNPIETDFPGAYEIFMNSGIGLVRSNFSSARNYNNLVRATKNIFSYYS